MKNSNQYYITTPIYYVTDAPHIGHLYTTLAADIMARYQRLGGKEVHFLTGTDEHGQKVEKKAKEAGLEPQLFTDNVVKRYLDAWKLYEITNDDFIRTTEDRHKKVVQHYIKTLMDKGDIYLSEYEGWYCVPDEAYWTDSQIVEGKCPDCGRTLERLKEESYFFRMSAYADRLLQYIKENPSFILPESRRNEVVSFLQQGVRDISVSRTTIQWGIPMPADPKATKQHKVYVWFDALTNYLSALSPLDSSSKVDKFWPEAIHIVGKDILRFHAVYWPTFLMALGLPLPKQIVAHGWLTDSNKKIGKSLGNAIDPIAIASEVGKEGLRYFLFREFVFGQDGEYTKQTLYQRINSDLANDFGNCVNRVCNMVEKYLGTGPIEVTADLKGNSPVRELATSLAETVDAHLRVFHYHKALESIFGVVSGINRFLENSAPWTLAKKNTPESQNELRVVLLHCVEGLRVASVLLLPFIPQAAAQALKLLGTPSPEKSTTAEAHWGACSPTIKVTKGAPLFPRLEWKEA